MSDNKTEEKEVEKPIVAKSAVDLQRLKLMKLMKNPDKPILLPERPKSKNTPMVPEFVRNVMGSSAGAGSGEFHVYRHLRRKEYSRQKFIQEKGKKELMDEEYQRKIEDNKKLAEEVTAKKRAKRLKKKQKQKQYKRSKLGNTAKNDQSDKSGESDVEEETSDTEEKRTDVKVCGGDSDNSKLEILRNSKVSETDISESKIVTDKVAGDNDTVKENNDDT